MCTHAYLFYLYIHIDIEMHEGTEYVFGQG